MRIEDVFIDCTPFCEPWPAWVPETMRGYYQRPMAWTIRVPWRGPRKIVRKGVHSPEVSDWGEPVAEVDYEGVPSVHVSTVRVGDYAVRFDI